MRDKRMAFRCEETALIAGTDILQKNKQIFRTLQANFCCHAFIKNYNL